ncbi:MAG: patatin-like phospholipase family protein [Rhizobiales bacterium]|nr:patatin-like phospholipase family protein [Hyphomicrobiales bacterium]
MANPSVKIGLALGGGGARGLAHIWAIKAIEELGLEVNVISGTSIGAMIGAAHASGMSGDDLLIYVQEKLKNTAKIVSQIFSASPSDLVDLLNPFKPALLNGETLLDILLPNQVVNDFSELKIPLKIITTNYYEGSEFIITKGNLGLAITASAAIPAVFRPVIMDGNIYIDGAYCNPVPYSTILDDCDFSIAINVNGRPIKPKKSTKKSNKTSVFIPTSKDVLYASNQLMQNRIMEERLCHSAPDIYMHAPIDKFKVMDFHKAQEILEATKPMKDALKREITLILGL